MGNALQLTKGATSGFYYTTDRRFRVSSQKNDRTASRVKVEWIAVLNHGTPAAVTVAEGTTLSTLRTRLAAYIANESK